MDLTVIFLSAACILNAASMWYMSKAHRIREETTRRMVFRLQERIEADGGLSAPCRNERGMPAERAERAQDGR